MTKEEIFQNNQQIAKFMGIKIVERNGEPAVFTRKESLHPAYFRTTRYNCYHESWNELMPVVNKIEGLGYSVEIIRYYCRISNPKIPLKTIIEAIYDTKLSATYQAVVSFIKQVKG